MYTRKIITGCSLLLAASSTTAGTTTANGELFELSLEQLMQMEVEIATGSHQSLSKAPAAVTVVTADDLKKTGATNAIEALESVPGVHIRVNRAFYTPFIHIRGTNTNQVLLMVNGVSMRSLTSAWPQDTFWKGLAVSAIERIEVIRGPGSALYGANASAGVVNIITKSAGSINQSRAGIRVGSFGAQTVWGQHGTEINGIDTGLTLELSHTDGHDPYIITDRSGTSGNIGLGYKNIDLRTYLARDNWRIQADYTQNYDVEEGFDGSGYFDSLTQGKAERINLGWLYSNEQFRPNWGVDAEVRYQDLNTSSGPGFLQSGSTISQQESSEQHLQLEVSGLYSGIKDHQIRIGGGHKWLDLSEAKEIENGTDVTGTSSAFALASTRKVDYLFLQDVWTLSDTLELTAGARFDEYSDFGSTTNPRLALVWNSTDKLTTKLMYGEAFRAPSFVETQNTTSSTLQPETSKTTELAFTYAASDNLTLGINLFEYEMEDIIKWVSASNQYENQNQFGVNGIELEAQWQAKDDLRISGNITLRNPDDNAERNDYEPYKDAYLRADWRFKPDWNWNLQANWIADRRRSDTNDNTENKIDGSTYDNMERADLDNNLLIDTTMRYNHSSQWEFAASIKNLLDDDALESSGRTVPYDLPLPERNFMVEARYKF